MSALSADAVFAKIDMHLHTFTIEDGAGYTAAIAISSHITLHGLAEHIIDTIGFDFDHAFGFYDNLRNPYQSKEKYTLFADLGEPEDNEPGVSSALMATNTKSAGIAKVSLISRKSLIGADYRILQLTFKVNGDWPSVIPVSVTKIRFFNAAAKQVSVESEQIDLPLVIPQSYSLLQNTPNPFNPETEIRYQIPQEGFVKLAIYNIKGQLVRTLVDKRMQAGKWKVVWKGKDQFGRDLPSGVYIYRIQASSFTDSKKMLFVK